MNFTENYSRCPVCGYHRSHKLHTANCAKKAKALGVENKAKEKRVIYPDLKKLGGHGCTWLA